MKLTTTTFIQGLTVTASVLSLASGIVPSKYMAAVAGAQGIVSAVLHQVAGNSNPDGTPATAPYSPAAKQQ